ncbi:MAG: winged helix DNA-binding domain-containing protein [Solirubrobacterales bacterium]|nr:winged helix DNA-binding domain-containing protein [Solirubrobacterales bacterium]
MARGVRARPRQGRGRPAGAEADRPGDRQAGGSRPAATGALSSRASTTSAPRREPPARRLAVRRAASQLLARPARVAHPADVTRLAGPVQAQEPRAARLAFRARARGLLAADVDRARCEERSLLRAWMMRRTAHLIATEDAGWLLPLFADSLARQARKRMADFGLDREGQDRALSLLQGAVQSDGPLTRPELAVRLTEAGFDASQQIKVHLWVLATVEGGLCLGPDRGGQTCLVATRDWIGELERPSREASLAELARRYLRAYAPADARDLARWAGLPQRDARAGFEAIAPELSAARGAGETLYSLAAERRRAAAGPVVRMLGAYDNYNLGYVSREFAVSPDHERRIAPGGGIIRPTISVDGRFVGTWASKRSGSRLAVTIEPFGELEPAVEEAIEAEIADLGRFEGLSAERVVI